MGVNTDVIDQKVCVCDRHDSTVVVVIGQKSGHDTVRLVEVVTGPLFLQIEKYRSLLSAGDRGCCCQGRKNIGRICFYLLDTTGKR